jgi:hypothetical protein
LTKPSESRLSFARRAQSAVGKSLCGPKRWRQPFSPRVRGSAVPVSEDGWMNWSKEQLDERIGDVLVDAYGDAEQLGSFACVLDDLLDKPVAASVVGEPVELLSVWEDGIGAGLRAKVRRAGRTWEVVLLDVILHLNWPRTDLTVAAYRKWTKGLG